MVLNHRRFKIVLSHRRIKMVLTHRRIKMALNHRRISDQRLAEYSISRSMSVF
jgi:hypothetical protein